MTLTIDSSVTIGSGSGSSGAGNSSVAIPSKLLSGVSSIATPTVILSPNEAYTDSGRATPATDGSLVQSMRDVSANGYNGAQATSGNRPTLRVGGISGVKPALDFNASATRGITASSAFAASGYSAGFTAYVVATDPGTIGGFNIMFGVGAGNYLQAGNAVGQIDVTLGGGGQTWATDPLDMNGVYVLAWDGATAVSGINGKYFSSAIANTNITSGDLIVGNNSNGNFNYKGGVIGNVYLFPGKHSSTVMDSIGAILAADSGLVKPSSVAIGDSLTVGFGLSTPSTMNYYAQTLASLGITSANYLIENFGLSGQTLAEMITENASAPRNRTGYASAVRGTSNVIFINGGTNDIFDGGGNISGEAAFANLQTLVALYATGGNTVFIGTIISRFGAGASFESRRLAFNALVRSAYPANRIMDFGGSSQLGQATSYLNTTYFQGDGIHPTEQGAAVMAQIANATVSSYYTSNSAATTYTTPKPAIKQVTGSTSGTAQFTMPEQEPYRKRVFIQCAALLGTAAYTFPTPFVNTPIVLSTSSLATSVVTAISTTAVTVTGAPSTGTIILEGY